MCAGKRKGGPARPGQKDGPEGWGPRSRVRPGGERRGCRRRDEETTRGEREAREREREINGGNGSEREGGRRGGREGGEGRDRRRQEQKNPAGYVRSSCIRPSAGLTLTTRAEGSTCSTRTKGPREARTGRASLSPSPSLSLLSLSLPLPLPLSLSFSLSIPLPLPLSLSRSLSLSPSPSPSFRLPLPLSLSPSLSTSPSLAPSPSPTLKLSQPVSTLTRAGPLIPLLSQPPWPPPPPPTTTVAATGPPPACPWPAAAEAEPGPGWLLPGLHSLEEVAVILFTL